MLSVISYAVKKKGQGMGLGLGLQLRQYQKCRLCKQPMDEHASDCPIGLKEQLLDKRPQISCPKCNGKVEINKSDWYECRKCHTQYSTGMVAPESEEQEVFLIDWNNDNRMNAKVLTEKGQGQFLIDEQLQRLNDLIKQKRQRKPV